MLSESVKNVLAPSPCRSRGTYAPQTYRTRRTFLGQAEAEYARAQSAFPEIEA